MDVSQRIKELCNEQGISVRKLERDIGVANGSVLRWASQSPSAETLEMVAERLGVSILYLLGKTDDIYAEYYIDPAVTDMAQEMKDNPDLKVLFDASRKLSKEDLELVLGMIERMKK